MLEVCVAAWNMFLPLWTVQLLKNNHNLYHALSNTYPVMVRCHLLLLPLWGFIGLYAIYKTLLLLSYCRQQSDLFVTCSYSSSLVFEVGFVPSATLGSIRSPLARRYGGRSAIFSLSEVEGFLPKITAWSFIQNESA